MNYKINFIFKQSVLHINRTAILKYIIKQIMWQLCIRLMYGMAFECELRYKKTISIEKLKYILLLFVIINIILNLIFVIV